MQAAELSTDDYAIRNIRLRFRVSGSRVEYTFSCDVEFFIRMFGRQYPTITRHIELTGFHNSVQVFAEVSFPLGAEGVRINACAEGNDEYKKTIALQAYNPKARPLLPKKSKAWESNKTAPQPTGRKGYLLRLSANRGIGTRHPSQLAKPTISARWYSSSSLSCCWPSSSTCSASSPPSSSKYNICGFAGKEQKRANLMPI